MGANDLTFSITGRVFSLPDFAVKSSVGWVIHSHVKGDLAFQPAPHPSLTSGFTSLVLRRSLCVCDLFVWPTFVDM